MATFRLFVALELPDGVGEALASWSAASLGDHDGLRLVAPSALHLTLCFLGATPASAVEAVASACADVMAGRAPVALSLRSAAGLPQRQPRVLAVEVGGPGVEALADLQAVLSSRLAADGWYRPETRPFLAHVTVARVRPRGRLGPDLLPAPADVVASPFLADTVTLFRSDTRPSGARYESLARITLGD